MTWERELISRRKWSQVRGALPRKRGQQRTSLSPWPRPVNGVAQPGQPKATREATGTASRELHKAGTRTPRRSQQSRHRSAQRHARDHAKRPRRAQPVRMPAPRAAALSVAGRTRLASSRAVAKCGPAPRVQSDCDGLVFILNDLAICVIVNDQRRKTTRRTSSPGARLHLNASLQLGRLARTTGSHSSQRRGAALFPSDLDGPSSPARRRIPWVDTTLVSGPFARSAAKMRGGGIAYPRAMATPCGGEPVRRRGRPYHPGAGLSRRCEQRSRPRRICRHHRRHSRDLLRTCYCGKVA